MHALRDKMNAGLARVTEANLDLALTQKKNLRALSAEYDALAQEVHCLPPLDAAAVLEDEYNYILTRAASCSSTRACAANSRVPPIRKSSSTSSSRKFSFCDVSLLTPRCRAHIMKV